MSGKALGPTTNPRQWKAKNREKGYVNKGEKTKFVDGRFER